MTSLSVKKLTCGYGDKVVLNNISFEVESGTFLGIVGPNGCGKTTLLKAIGGIIKSDGVEISEKNRNLFSLAEIAREIAYVPQLLEPIDGLNLFICSAIKSTSSFAAIAATLKELGYAETTSRTCLPMDPVEPKIDIIFFMVVILYGRIFY